MTDSGIARSTEVTKLVDPLVDLGNLLLIDRDPLDENRLKQSLKERARESTQFLFNKIWELEKKRVDDAIVAKLPPSTYRLPREKSIPEKKAMTRWEEYAQKKGIQKVKKRNNKVWDEQAKEWKPRYGYRRGNDNTKDWIAEVPDHRDPMTDIFEERKQAKRERVEKNEIKRMKNIARQLQIKSGNRVPDMREVAKIGMGIEAEDRTKQQVRVAADRAKVATASIGKFQAKIHNEKPNVKTGKKRKFEGNLTFIPEEKKRNLSILSNLLDKNQPSTGIDESKAASVAKEGPARKEKGVLSRQKNRIHRQQFFDKKVKDNKKTRGNVRKEQRKK